MGRSPCCDKNGLKKGPWTTEEDTKLIQYIQMHGPGNWRNLPKNAGLQRCGKSCRLRWTNYLRPDIKRGRFSFEEEETIIQLHSVLGNKWSAIAARLPGRTDNEIKNYWNTHIRKRLLRNGIDPVTHSPRLDLLHISTLLTSQQNQLDLSNLLRLQTLLSNPEALRIALSSLLSSSSSSSHDYQNPNTLLQRIQENDQLSNCQDQQTPVFQPNQFEDIINKQIPLNNNTPNYSAFQSDHQIMQQGNSGTTHQYSRNSNFQDQNMQISFFGSFDNDRIEGGNMSDNTSFYQSTMNSNSSQNFSFDSVLSTPSVSVNNIDGAAQDTDDDLFKFEIPESFDLDELL